MSAIAAIAVGVLFGAGMFLVLKRDIVKVAAGTVLISNAALLFVLAGAFAQPAEPLAPLPPASMVADPLVQSFGLTAIVITFGVSVLLLEVCVAVARTHDTVDLEAIAAAEREDEARFERQEE